MKTKEEILKEYIDKESMDELSGNVWPDMLEAMEEYSALRNHVPDVRKEVETPSEEAKFVINGSYVNHPHKPK